MALSRRTFVKGVAIAPFAVWLEEQGWAQPPAPVTRWDARSPQGVANLKIYADAVTKMRNTTLFAEGNPRSWTFQWYTHQVKGNIQQAAQNKAGEIQRIYGNPPSAWKALAQEMWNTCQSHLGQPEDYFLPWHRMYVLYFESIIRKVTGKPAFTLPYWNYTKAGPTFGIIPPEFTKPNDPVLKSLYVDKRNPWVNNNEPIDKFKQPGTNPLNLNALRQCHYSFVSDARPGFCQALDFGLHGQVHVLTGNTMNMGRVPWAAYDPIFWLHHCNIDRLWASWNQDPNRKNPGGTSFLNKKFVFVNGDGNRVEPAISSVLSIAALGYKYQELEPLTPASCPPSTAAAASRKLVATKTPAIALGAGPVKATLDPVPATGAQAAVALGTRIEKLAANRALFLVVSGLQTNAAPGVIYNLFLELPATPGNAAAEYWVGSINFFAAEHHHGDQKKSHSFDITDLARKLKAKGRLAAKAELTIAPVGTPAADAKPVIGEVSLHEG